MKSSRRDFLRHALCSAGAAALGSACAKVPASPVRTTPRLAPMQAPRQRPHYYVLLVMVGGMDHLLTFHGLAQDEVGTGIDCGYRADDRVRGVQRFYGPCIGGMFRHEADLAIVHGVRCNTVSHGEGLAMLVSGKRHPSGSPFLSRIGPHLIGDAPAPSATLFPAGITPWPLDETLVLDPYTLATALDPRMPRVEVPPWFDTLAAVQTADARDFPSEAREWFETNVHHSAIIQSWLGRTSAATSMRDPNIGPALHMTLSGIRHNLSRSFVIVTKYDYFDTHSENERLQKTRLLPAMNDIASFIDALKSERNEFGSLFDQTTIAIGSELGRYPKLNQALGKDHWPESTWVLLGKGVKRGITVGGTNPRYQGLPVNYASGVVAAPDARPIFLDSVFATVARILAGDAKLGGYRESDVLDCVLAS